LGHLPFVIYRDYIFQFWLEHKPLAAIALVIWIAVFYFDALETLFYKFVPRIPTNPHFRKRDNAFRRVRQVCYLLSIGISFITFPFIGLVAEAYTVLLPVFFSLLLTGISLILAHDQYSLQRPRMPLSRYHYPKSDFNVAELAPESTEVRREREIYQRYRPAPMNPTAREYIERGSHGSIWKGLQPFWHCLSQTFEVDATHLRLERNTTSGIRHALQEMISATKEVTLITTDAEYPQVADIIDSYGRNPAPQVKVRKIKVADRIWNNNLQPDDLVGELNDEVDKWRGGNGDICICTSHVYWESALKLPISSLREKIGEDVHLLIDGAQAFGNVHVGQESLQQCSYYITSGHKWLLGKSTLGILYRNQRRCAKIPEIPSGDSMSSLRDLFSGNPGGTVDIEAFVALNTSLKDLLYAGLAEVAKHNELLADLFRDWSRQLPQCVPMPSRGGGGIVMLQVDDPDRVWALLNRRYRIQSTVFPKRRALRLCFHYYHGENDVYSLIEKMTDTLS